jgi:hypothetical protein
MLPEAGTLSCSLRLAYFRYTYGYSIDLGPFPSTPTTMFELEPTCEARVHLERSRTSQSSALVDRRKFVWLSTMKDEEPVMLTQHLSDTDSMLACVADPAIDRAGNICA